jgi:hypothetical protein
MAAGKQLDGGWKVEYTEIKRADGIDMDPHYIAPEVALLLCPFAGARRQQNNLCARGCPPLLSLCWCKATARQMGDMCQETFSLPCFALSSPPSYKKPARAEKAIKKVIWLDCSG